MAVSYVIPIIKNLKLLQQQLNAIFADILARFTAGQFPSAAIIASENLAAGALVNVWSSSGSPRVRNADSSTTGKQADGYVSSAVTSGNAATVFFGGIITGLTSLAPGAVWLGVTGAISTSAAASSGQTAQRVGTCIDGGTQVVFQRGDAVEL